MSTFLLASIFQVSIFQVRVYFRNNLRFSRHSILGLVIQPLPGRLVTKLSLNGNHRRRFRFGRLSGIFGSFSLLGSLLLVIIIENGYIDPIPIIGSGLWYLIGNLMRSYYWLCFVFVMGPSEYLIQIDPYLHLL